jgi:hypothetical protein
MAGSRAGVGRHRMGLESLITPVGTKVHTAVKKD